MNARMVLALEALRRAAHELHTCGSAEGRDDVIAGALLIGELGSALGSGRADPSKLEEMVLTVEDWAP